MALAGWTSAAHPPFLLLFRCRHAVHPWTSPTTAPALSAYSPSMDIKKARLAPGFSCHSNDAASRLLTVNGKLGAAVARTTFLGVVRVDRVALAKALYAGDLAGVDAMRGQVVIDDLRAALRKLLVVLVTADGIGVTIEF